MQALIGVAIIWGFISGLILVIVTHDADGVTGGNWPALKKTAVIVWWPIILFFMAVVSLKQVWRIALEVWRE